MENKFKKKMAVIICCCLILTILSGTAGLKVSSADDTGVKDGTYSIPVSLWHASKDSASMGNNALQQTGKLVASGGDAQLYLKFTSMEFSGMSGYLMQLDLLEDITFNEYNYPEKYKEKAATVVSRYSIVDQYNGPSSTDVNCAGKQYPKVLKIPVTIGQQYTWAHVYVPVMGELDSGDQVCRIKLDFDAMSEMTSDEAAEWEAAEKDDEGGTSGETGNLNKTELKKYIDQATALLGKTDTYTEASLNQLQAALDTAKKTWEATSTTQTVVDAQAKSLKAAIDGLIKKSSENLDKNNLKNGKYTVYVDLWHATSNKASMGNPTMNHKALLTVKDGTYTMDISTHPMTVGTITACLQTLQIKQSDGSYKYAQITAKNNPGKQPSVFRFVLPSKDTYIPVLIDPKVEVMGEDPLPARLKISWDTLAKAADNAKVEENTKAVTAGLDTKAVDITHKSTKVRVKAAKNILVNGVKLSVKKLTSGSDYTKTKAALSSEGSKMTIYDITLYSPENSKVQPNGMVKVYLPIPKGYNKNSLAVYRMSGTNKTKMTAKVSNGTCVFSTNHFSIFALVDTSTASAGGGGSGGTASISGGAADAGDMEETVEEEMTDSQQTGQESGTGSPNTGDALSMNQMMSLMLLGISMLSALVMVVLVIAVFLKLAMRRRNS